VRVMRKKERDLNEVGVWRMGTEERGTVARLLSGQGRGKEDGHRRAGNSGPPAVRAREGEGGWAQKSREQWPAWL